MVHRLQFRAMGTDMLVCVDNGSSSPPPELEQVPGWFEYWEQTLSRFRIDSELTLLNRTNEQFVPVSETLWRVFQSAVMAERFTEGVVTPTVAAAMIGAGYDRDFDLLAGNILPALEVGPAPVRSVESISWNSVDRSLCLPAGMQLDFGGIAKGWAAEQAVHRLAFLGSALMNCGGDIFMSGPLLNGSPWEIGIHRPFDRSSGYIGMLYLNRACGVATSSTDRRRWMQGDELRHHIIDPGSGMPAESDVISATIIAPTAVEAETAAKYVIIRGSAHGMEWIEKKGLDGLVMLEDGSILYSQKMDAYL